jgi:hypothetical protein
MRFAGLELSDSVPDAKTIWLYRETLARAGAFERLFERFDMMPRNQGWLAMGGQIVDATVIEARRPRLSEAEKDTIRGGGTPGHWTKARTAQIDRERRWTIKRGRKRAAPPGRAERRAAPEIAVPMFCYKNSWLWPVPETTRNPADDPLDHDVELRSLSVVGGRYELDSAVRDQAMDLVNVAVGPVGVIDGNRVSALVGEHLHRRNVGFPVTNEDHAFERDRALGLWHARIYRRVVPAIGDALVNPK